MDCTANIIRIQITLFMGRFSLCFFDGVICAHFYYLLGIFAKNMIKKCFISTIKPVKMVFLGAKTTHFQCNFDELHQEYVIPVHSYVILHQITAKLTTLPMQPLYFFHNKKAVKSCNQSITLKSFLKLPFLNW